MCTHDPDCGKAFAQEDHLASHKRTHTGERPFVCTYDPDCGKAFAEAGHLARHKRTHTGERPIVCRWGVSLT